jgi:tRNA(Ile)-lysidine synthase
LSLAFLVETSGSFMSTHPRTGLRLERDVLRYTRKNQLLPEGERAVVGVSGGADSTALLVLLVRLATKLGIDVRAAYFDHQLRGGKASAQELGAVEALADKLNVPLSLGSGDVKAHARERKTGIEEAARVMRYSFLAKTAREYDARTVAVGHTADDQVETVLMHILRGSGLAGLAGMSPLSPWPFTDNELRLVRPLLEVRRSETEAYCREAGLEPLEDTSNRSSRYRRNVVRNEVLPLLREHVPGVDENILRLARVAESEQRSLQRKVNGILGRAARTEGGAIRLSLGELREAPPELLPEVMRLAVARLLGESRDFGERHLRAMSEAVTKPAGTSLNLPRGLGLLVDYEEIRLSRIGAGRETESLPVEGVELEVPGYTKAGDWRIEAVIDTTSGRPEEGEARVDADSLRGKLIVRRRKAGDRYRPLGLAGEKKLQDILVDAKVPRWGRDALPVVCDEEGIVWVAGYRIDERVKVTGSTRRVLRLRAKHIDST